MFIEQIRVVNCNRFTLGDRKEIVIKPRSKIQMILGTNGSGKSSFMELCFSPLSPSPNDFEQGGQWEFICSVGGERFVLFAAFDKKHYSFKRNGEELNQGHTITVQDALVEQHLHYTRFVHDILTMKTKLTALSSTNRVDVISKVSREDFTYAFAQYRDWSRKHNASRSVQKFLDGRVIEERAKLMEEADVRAIESNMAALQKQITQYMSVKLPDVDTSIDYRAAIDTKIVEFHALMDKMIAMDLPSITQGSTEAETALLNSLQGRLDQMSTSIEAIGSELAVLENKKQEADRLSGIDIEQVENELAELKVQFDKIPAKNIDVPDEWLHKNDVVTAKLLDTMSGLPASIEDFNTDYKKVTAEVNAAVQTLNKAQHTLSGIEQRIDQLNRIKTITCPSCTHAFKPGIDQDELNMLQERLLRGTQHVMDLDSKNRSVFDHVALLEDQKTSVETLYRLRELHFNDARGLFMYLDTLGGLKRGKALISYIAIYTKEVAYRLARDRYMSRITVLEHALEEHRTKNIEISHAMLDYARVKAQYDNQYSEMSSVKVQQDQINIGLSYMSRYTQAFDYTEAAYTDLIETIKDGLGALMVTMVQQQIGRYQTTLAINDNALSNDELVRNMVADLESQLTKITLETQAFKTLSDAMSPKSGLIADRIRIQIGSKIEGINTIINKIWNYDYKIHMPDFTSGSLDYKFPITVGKTERSDISKGSGSMKCIVDTAFMVVAHHSLQLDGYPIFLDEFDAPFDGVHTENMIALIKDLADSGRYAHVVVISHDESIQNAFPDAEVLVLDDRNLSADLEVNTHATFK